MVEFKFNAESAQENQRTQDLELLMQIMNSRLKSLAKLNSDFDYEGTTEESSIYITQNSQLFTLERRQVMLKGLYMKLDKSKSMD